MFKKIKQRFCHHVDDLESWGFCWHDGREMILVVFRCKYCGRETREFYTKGGDIERALRRKYLYKRRNYEDIDE